MCIKLVLTSLTGREMAKCSKRPLIILAIYLCIEKGFQMSQEQFSGFLSFQNHGSGDDTEREDKAHL